MKRFTIMTLSVFAVALTVTLAASDKVREEKLQQAIDLIESKGDLAKATPLLEDVAKSSDRALAARGLLQLAQAQERFGKSEALATYRRIVNDFGRPADAALTSSAVAAARTKIAALAQSADGVATRQILGFEGDRISADGRYTAFTDKNGDLVVHEVTSGRNRVLTGNSSAPKERFADDNAFFSPDGKSIAYGWDPFADYNSKFPFELRVINSGGGQPRIVYPNTDKAADFVTIHGWTPDGKWILARAHKASAQDLLLVPAAGGTSRILKRFADASADRFSLSPDGRAVAYSRPAEPGRAERDVWILSVDTGLETPVTTHAADDYMLEWFPSGDRILFGSDRGGTFGIWAIRVTGGRGVGEARLVRPDTGPISWVAGFTGHGDFYYNVIRTQDEIHVASLDPTTGLKRQEPVRLEGRFVGGKSAPAWSPAGDRIAYIQGPSIVPPQTGPREPVRGDLKLAIQTISTGAVNLLSTGLRTLSGPAWLPDGSGLVVQGSDGSGRQGLFLVKADQPTATLLPDSPAAGAGPGVSQPNLSPDGKKIYVLRLAVRASDGSSQGRGGIVVRDFATGVETWLQTSVPTDGSVFALSPDGKWIVLSRLTGNPAPDSRQVFVIPTSGGEARSLSNGQSYDGAAVAWSQDGRFVFLTKIDPTSPKRVVELWRVPIDGSKPVSTGIRIPGLLSRIRPHADGVRLAIAARTNTWETWVLQNLPTMKDK